MPHITLPDQLPGIRSLVAYRPDTGELLYKLAEALLRDESPIPGAERELIAAFVSSLNECRFCASSHSAASRELYRSEAPLVDSVLQDYRSAPISGKLKSLLTIAEKVRENGRAVTEKEIREAREQGAEDREIHDTVLIAAAFSMFNRYVDGLATLTPHDESDYREMGRRMAESGYAGRFKQVIEGGES